MYNENMKCIAHIKCDLTTKFGVPRQSGLAGELKGRIIFEPEYRKAEAFRGLEDYSHIWLIWEFSEAKRENWSPTVRPPRLGGNKRMGVFATRSPFRPNPIGLSAVKLDSIEYSSEYGPVLHVSGADLMDGTPIFDVKPYLPYADSHPEASGGFTDTVERKLLRVEASEGFRRALGDERYKALVQILQNDPRPSYQDDPERVYGFEYAGYEVHFRVDADVLTVIGIDKN